MQELDRLHGLLALDEGIFEALQKQCAASLLPGFPPHSPGGLRISRAHQRFTVQQERRPEPGPLGQHVCEDLRGLGQLALFQQLLAALEPKSTTKGLFPIRFRAAG